MFKPRILHGNSVFITTHCGDSRDFKLLENLVEQYKHHANWIELVNSHDANGDTPLTTACTYGNKNAVEVLLENGADPNKTNKNGRFPIKIAEQRGHEYIVGKLENKLMELKNQTTFSR
jgi:ankyrin repeat protein